MTHCPGKANPHSRSAAHKAHEMCNDCKDISLGPRESSSWICCHCRNLVSYDDVIPDGASFRKHRYVNKNHCTLCFRLSEAQRMKFYLLRKKQEKLETPNAS